MAPRIAWVEENDAKGRVAELYAEAHRMFGRVSPIVKTFSGHPDALAGMLAMCQVHFAEDGALSRAQREIIATHAAALQGCHY